MSAVTDIECCGTAFSFKDFFEHLNESHGVRVTALFDLEKTWKLEGAESEMLDLRDLPYLEIQVNNDGKTIWLNTLEKCIVRIQNIDKIILNDRRG